MATRTRVIVYGGVTAALYVVLTIGLAPLSYGPLQFRVSEILKPLALFHPVFAITFGVGNGLANLMSPFGPWDFIGMAFVDAGAAWLCWALRRVPWLALSIQATMISVGVAVLPLHFGGGIPIWPTVAFVWIPEMALILGAYYLGWRKYGPDLLRQRE